MRGKVWVGRVKSNCPPEFLEAEFAKIGKLVQVETGFAGFAFVDYEDEEDADDACKKLNKTFLQNVGEVLVSRATQRGYDDACSKRDIYQRTKGRIGEVYQCGDRGSRGMYGSSRSPRRSRSRGRSSASRSPSRKRQRADSRSRSLGRSRHLRRQSPSLERKFRPKNRSPSASPRKRSRSSERSKSKVRSCSRSRSKSPLTRPSGGKPENGSRSPPREALESNVESRQLNSPPRDEKPEPDPVPDAKPRARSESPPSVPRGSKIDYKDIVPKEGSPAAALDTHDQPHAASDPYRLALEPVTSLAPLVPIFDRADAGASLSSSDRSALVQFFDGASTRELLLESAAVLSVPELFSPDVLNGFPHSFHGLSQEGVINLLNVFSSFICSGAPPAGERSAEVRQTIVVNKRGQRVMRKTIVVDGNVCCSEEQVLS